MLRIDYRAAELSAVVWWDDTERAAPWVPLLRRLILDATPNAKQETSQILVLPWWNFVALRRQLQEIFATYELGLGTGFQVSAQAAELLRRSTRVAAGYADATRALELDEAELRERLAEIGFGAGRRDLSAEQIRNVRRMAALPAAATFSVPGAGKTTEALAFFFHKARCNERLLVVAPKNAFAAWDEQVAECMPSIEPEFVRLRGGRDRIGRLLADDPRFMLISYQQLARVGDVLAAHIAQHQAYVFLDESHRIKSGVARQTARAVLGLSHLPVGKLIMTGTPMPQSVDDLIPQFSFLYPEIAIDPQNVVERVEPVYVRTTKAELGLRPPNVQRVPLEMAPLQAELYSLMKFEVARQARAAMNARSKQALRSLGRSVSRLLQFVSNPSLLGSDLNFANPNMLAAVLEEGEGPKLRYVLRKTRKLTSEGKKVLIWSSFVRNVEYMSDRLADLGAVYIHGGVDAGDEDDDETREGKIKVFHDDPNCMVMVANPAAASEGVSLHRICHHAIYLDRTFNAAHFLQSQDRIHRFGLPPDQDTTIEIVECRGTVDDTVHQRLLNKINAMSDALNDPSIRVDPIIMDPQDVDDYDELSAGLSEEDVEALLRDIDRGAA